jgi:DNA polymerase III delta prime subunit
MIKKYIYISFSSRYEFIVAINYRWKKTKKIRRTYITVKTNIYIIKNKIVQDVTNDTIM